ncbi:hypothetical protein ECTW09195_4849, partial [Escherichia coli TW09195]
MIAARAGLNVLK